MTNTATTWFELSFDRVGGEIRLGARGSRNEQLAPQSLSVDPAKLVQFASDIELAARYGQPIAGPVLELARTFQKAVLDGPIGTLYARLGEAAHGPLLMRLLVCDPELQGVPWEALCNPGEALGFWGTSPKVHPVRGVTSNDAWLPREIRGAVKVLAIAPTGGEGLDNLKQALADRIGTGEVEWLEPIAGPAAKVEHLPHQLRMRSAPHIIHFLGHGAIINGLPMLRLADDNDEPKWLPVEVIGQHLQAGFFETLRLVVLEACEGAKSTAFASAAETLAKAGADAVVAHLWPVRADVARTFSTTFYRALTSIDARGDVAMAVNIARRGVLASHDASAESMSSVLYLCGSESKIFDFDHRNVLPPRATVTMPEGTPEVPPALGRLVRGRFSLVFGDRWRDNSQVLDAFRQKLQSELKKANTRLPEGLPIGTLAQWFALHRGGETLEQEFQDTFDLDMEGPSIVASIARVLCPGVHTTLLRNPWLEQSVAEQQPQRTIYVIQPSTPMALVMKREAGARKWERLPAAPESFREDQDILVLRPCRGYTSNKKFVRPLLTEDDYFLGLRDLWNGTAMPPNLAELLGGTLSRSPALLLGLSMFTANHRMLLHTLYARGLPHGSLAVVDEDDHERESWEKGAGLPGRHEGIKVVETPSGMLCKTFEALARGVGVEVQR